MSHRRRRADPDLARRARRGGDDQRSRLLAEKARAPNIFSDEHGGKIPVGVERTVVPAAPDAWITALEKYGTMSSPRWRRRRSASPARVSRSIRYMANFIRDNETAIRRFPSTVEMYLPQWQAAGGRREIRADRPRRDLAVHRRRGAGRGARRPGRRACRRRATRSIAATSPAASSPSTAPKAGCSTRTIWRRSGSASSRRCAASSASVGDDLRAVVPGADAVAGTGPARPRRAGALRPQHARIHPRDRRGDQARLRRPRGLLRRSALCRGADGGLARRRLQPRAAGDDRPAPRRATECRNPGVCRAPAGRSRGTCPARWPASGCR